MTVSFAGLAQKTPEKRSPLQETAAGYYPKIAKNARPARAATNPAARSVRLNHHFTSYSLVRFGRQHRKLTEGGRSSTDESAIGEASAA